MGLGGFDWELGQAPRLKTVKACAQILGDIGVVGCRMITLDRSHTLEGAFLYNYVERVALFNRTLSLYTD